MSGQTGHTLMALGTLLSLGARMTVVAVLINPSGGMRIGMPRHQVAPMAHLAISRFGRPWMAGVAVRRAPARSMGIRMGVDRPLMAQGAARPPLLTGMALEAVIVPPARIMTLRLGLLMAGRTGILLMANHALRTVPGRLDTMGLQTPQVVVGRGLGYLVTLPAGRFAMAHRAGLFILTRQNSVALRPLKLVTRRRRSGIQVDMAGRTVGPGNMNTVTDLEFSRPAHRRNGNQFLIHQVTMAFRAAVGQGVSMREQARLRGRRHFLIGGRQGRQFTLEILYLMTFAAGCFLDLLLIQPVAMAIPAGIVTGHGKPALLGLPMTVRTGHAIVLDMEAMVEDQFAPLLVAPRRQNRSGDQHHSRECPFHETHPVHNLTSMEARAR